MPRATILLAEDDPSGSFVRQLTRCLMVVSFLLLASTAHAQVPKEFRQALDGNNVTAVKDMVSKDPSLLGKLVGTYLETPVTYAARQRQVEMVKALIAAGSDVNKKGFMECPPLFVAVESGSVEIVDEFIKAGVDLTATNILNDNIFCRAVASDKIEMVQYFFGKGFKLANDKRTVGAVRVASIHGNVPMLEFLEKNGANIPEVTPKGENALHDTTSLPTIRWLLARKVDVNARAAFGETPLYRAAFARNFDAVKLLIEAGADPNLIRANGDSALRLAATIQSPAEAAKTVGMLLDKGANPNLGAGTFDGPPILIAVTRGDMDLLEIFLKNKADVNLASENGATPIMIAVWRKHAEMLPRLAAAGANPNTYDDDGYTPLMHAQGSKNEQLVNALLAIGAKEMPRGKCTNIHKAIRRNDFDAVKEIVAANPTALTTIDWMNFDTPLTTAVASGRQNIAAWLIENGAKVDQISGGDFTILHTAAYHGQDKLIPFCIAQGIAPDARDSQGRTALHIAAIQGDTTTATALLACGANPSATTSDGLTPADFVRKLRSRSTLLALLERSAATRPATSQPAATSP